MATRRRFPGQHRWKAIAAQILIGTLTCQISLIDTALAAPRALAASDVALTGLMIPASADNPAETINRATDGSVVITADIPVGASKFMAELVDQSGKHADDKSRVLTPGVATATINAIGLADGPITLRASIELSDGTKTSWVTGPQVLKDTQRPDKPTLTVPLDTLTTLATTTTIQGETAEHVTVRAMQDRAIVGQTDSANSFSLALPLTQGANHFKLMAIDAAGNQSMSTNVPTITSTAVNVPTQTLPAPTHLHATSLSNSRVHLSWMIDNAQLVDHFAIFSDNGTGTVDFSTPLATTPNNTTDLTTTTLPQGTYHFTVRSVDSVGTMTTNTDTVTQSVMGEQTRTSITGGQQLIDFRPEQPVTVQTGTQTTRHGKLSIESLGLLNPTKQLLPSSTPVGNFYDLTTTNQTIFPLEVRMYYTTSDLAAAHVTNERQLEGLDYFDTTRSAWTPFDQAQVNTTDLTVNGINYAGYVMATTTHLTTMVIAADTIAPTNPTNLTAEAGDMRTKLTWNTVADATGYWVRYRKATSIDTVPYTTVFVSGQQQTSFTVSGLANGTLYEFGLAAEDSAGNQSAFAVVEQTPTAATPTTDFITPATARLTSASSSHATTSATTTTQPTTSSSSSTNQSPEQTTPTQENQNQNQDGTVKGGTTQKDQTQSARSLVTLLIVLVAAAAGFGGYYGYQWWTARPEEFDEPTESPEEAQPPKKTEKPEKSDRTGGRW